MLHGEAADGVGVVASEHYEARMDVLMTRPTEQHTVGRRPAAAVAAPHRLTDRRDRRAPRGTPFALHGDVRFRSRLRGPLRGHGQRPRAVMVRSAQTRTPGICTALFSARTTLPSLV